jgi:hypothetical protein
MATNDKRNTVIVDPSSMLEDEQLDIIHISQVGVQVSVFVFSHLFLSSSSERERL